MEIVYQPIGIVHSPFTDPGTTPIQSQGAKGTAGKVELFEKYVKGLDDLDGFSHIILIYQFHLSIGFSLKVFPYLDKQERGVFSTRAPRRPNAIGMSIVQLDSIEGNVMYISDLDIIDRTPLLDIKPYVPQFDPDGKVNIGWLEKNIDLLG
jgi:tRNA-Thr(GGU) m(6)t(6)A37 methyltransferase TsaA